MPNKKNKAYGLTCLCPIRVGIHDDHRSFAAVTRSRLQLLERNEGSPFAKIPQTYMCRLFVLDDFIYQGRPARYEQLKSDYLVFTSNFHGELDRYLEGMWQAIEEEVREIWEFCVGFDKVKEVGSYLAYIKKCQVTTTFFFDGSTDDPLEVQLKSLYLKQKFSEFVFGNQGVTGVALKTAFDEFVKKTQPENLRAPTWKPGAATLEVAEGSEGKPTEYTD